MQVNNNKNNINISNKNIPNERNNLLYKGKNNNMLFDDIVNGIKDAANYKEANQILFNAVEKGDMTVKNGVLFKCGDFTVQTMLKCYSDNYINNQKKISDLNLSISNKYIDSVEKGNDVYIISQIPGTKTGDLIPFYQAKSLVSKEDLQQAFQDLQKLTKEGITDQRVLDGSMIFVTPDDHKIMIPSWEAIRPISQDETPNIIERYRQILFS